MDRSHLPRWIVAVFVFLFLLTGGAVAAWSVQLPYFAFSPGPVADAVDSVEALDGTEVFPPEGELLMLTISSQEVNPYEMLIAAVDPTVDLVRKQAIRQVGETDEEYQQRSLQMMDRSEQTAIAVALDRLGIDPITDGVAVESVIEGFPAEGVLLPGDVIREIEGGEVHVVGDIAEALEGRSPGDEVELTIERDGERQTVTVELGGSEEDGKPLVGITAFNLDPRFPVEIESGNVGGPSAGLMYTLAVIDLLTEGDLTNGVVIAGTGTIQPDGSVGPIGGIRQKVVAAEAAGAEVMLVPEGNYDEALTAPRERLELVPVATIDDALAFLSSLPAEASLTG